MTQRNATEFDEEVRRVVEPLTLDGTLLLRPVATVVWGRPVQGE
jgi:hypothetical protein